jgi:hypothetical protein
MRTLLFIAALMHLSIVNAQTSDIEATFNEYVEATHSDDVREQLDYFYPQMFEFLPKENMIEGLKRTKESDKINIGKEKLISISEVYEEDGGKYALLTYKVELTLDVADLKDKQGGEESAMDMKDAYEEEHGPENVNFNQDTYLFTINFTNTLYAILDNQIGSWKFLPKDETTTMITEEVIPEGIRAKL